MLFTGFQAVGTLGRILQDGARSVRIQGEEFAVRARIRSLDLYSGHADGTELRDWIKERLNPPEPQIGHQAEGADLDLFLKLQLGMTQHPLDGKV